MKDYHLYTAMFNLFFNMLKADVAERLASWLTSRPTIAYADQNVRVRFPRTSLTKFSVMCDV